MKSINPYLSDDGGVIPQKTTNDEKHQHKIFISYKLVDASQPSLNI